MFDYSEFGVVKINRAVVSTYSNYQSPTIIIDDVKEIDLPSINYDI